MMDDTRISRRATILTADSPGDHLEVTNAEITALVIAVSGAIGTPTEGPLTSLLRKLDVDNERLAVMDRIAREYADRADEVDEQLPAGTTETGARPSGENG